MHSRRFLLRAIPAMATAAIAGNALAAGRYPDKLIKIIVGNAAGGTDDAISRYIANRISSDLGQAVIVENRGGGSTTIAGNVVAHSAPDGYTLLCLINTGIVQTVLREKLTYNINSFVPIVGVGGFPLALAVSATSTPQIKTIDDLKTIAQSPSGVTFASGGVGTMAHLNTVRFLKVLKGKGVHVAYRNNPEGLQGLAGGFTQMMFASASEVAALRGDGMLRVLAVTSAQRLANLPDVPTMKELGFAEINPTIWHGYVAPAGTPASVVEALSTAIVKAVKEPEFQARFKPMSFVEDIKTGPELDAFIGSEAARWREVIVENNIKIND
jgi:tripartite-type tricarboxylate transporter receptor subunit TctC